MPDLIEMTSNQRRMLVDTRQLWDARDADPAAGIRKMRSFGPRSPDTEKTYEAFVTGRAEAQERLESLGQRL
ncbi:hypothetical protein [Skermanella pratensis]|uniref:hypothetical protein n=1 Tax=Skermanella pratensis TaxID=2233999 RepID=UPI0013018D20|nr:hypothetical protein [Skermanella pratensis]